MKERLIHILDQSVCLSRKQMKEYLNGTMQREEMHAAEVHLISCPLCSMAMEGFEAHTDEALAAIASLNSGFLKEHFENIAPQIHLNSMAPAAALPASHPARKRGNIQPIWRTASIAAALLLTFGVLWFVEFGHKKNVSSSPLAMADRAKADMQPARRDKARAQEDVVQQAATTSAPAMKEETQGEATTAATSRKGTEKENAVHLVASANGKGAADNVATQDVGRQPVMGTAAPAGAVPEQDESEQKKSEQLAKSPVAFARREQNTSQDAIASGGRASTKYVTASAPAKSRPAATAEKSDNAAKDRSPMELGDESYEKGKFSAALAHYKQQMNKGDERTRYQATIKAARCYATLGNKVKAEQLLQSVISEGSGPERRAARRILRDLE